MCYGSEQKNGYEITIKVKTHKLQSWALDLEMSDFKVHILSNVNSTEHSIYSLLNVSENKIERFFYGINTCMFNPPMTRTLKEI